MRLPRAGSAGVGQALTNAAVGGARFVTYQGVQFMWARLEFDLSRPCRPLAITRQFAVSVIHGCGWWRRPVGRRIRKGRVLARRGPWGQAEVVHQTMAILPGRRPAEFSIVRTAAPSGCLFRCRCRDLQGAAGRIEFSPPRRYHDKT